MKNRKISVILPMYNEYDVISKTLIEVLLFARKHRDYEFIFVDDGSTDDTKDFILEVKATSDRYAQLKIVSYPKNKGKGYAVGQGVLHSEGEYICFLDSDLAYSLEHLPIMVEKLKNNDVVIGNRGLVSSNSENISTLRILFGRVFNLCMRVILGLNFNDLQSGIKGFTRIAARDLFSSITIEGWSFDTELLFIAKKRGYSIGEIPVKVSKSHLNKESKIKLFKDSIEMFLSLIKIRLNDWLGKYNER